VAPFASLAVRDAIDRAGEIVGHQQRAVAQLRQGLAAEAAQALVRYGFERLGLKRLIALIDPAHTASIRTAESAGLRFKREVEMEGVRSAVYALERQS